MDKHSGRSNDRHFRRKLRHKYLERRELRRVWIGASGLGEPSNQMPSRWASPCLLGVAGYWVKYTRLKQQCNNCARKCRNV